MVDTLLGPWWKNVEHMWNILTYAEKSWEHDAHGNGNCDSAPGWDQQWVLQTSLLCYLHGMGQAGWLGKPEGIPRNAP